MIDKLKKKDIGGFFGNSDRVHAMNELYPFIIIIRRHKSLVNTCYIPYLSVYMGQIHMGSNMHGTFRLALALRSQFQI